jgi:CBS domain-containing protein
MLCPECQYDNISGVDECANCGSALGSFDQSLSELERSITSEPVSSMPAHLPVTVSATDSARDAIACMNSRHIGCVLVEQDGAVVGIFTERDVLNRVTSDLSALDRPVSEVMTPNPETVHEDETVAYALHAMSVHGYRHLPVANDQGQAISIISARDVLRLLSDRFASAEAN